MTGVTLIETETLQALIHEVQDLKLTVMSTIKELKETKKPYLTVNEVIELTGFGKTWVHENKQLIGFSSLGGALRFKRKDVEDFMEQNYFKSKSRK